MVTININPNIFIDIILITFKLKSFKIKENSIFFDILTKFDFK